MEKYGRGIYWLISAICRHKSIPPTSQVTQIDPFHIRYGTAEQIEKFIPDMTAGKKIGALGMTEPAAGSDLQGIRTYAKQDGDDWIINGSKVFITNGYLSDVVVVVAVTNPQV